MHVASEIASQARIASLTKQLEASRAEAAEMQDRLMGFEGERRKLEARDTHTYMYVYAYWEILVHVHCSEQTLGASVIPSMP